MEDTTEVWKRKSYLLPYQLDPVIIFSTYSITNFVFGVVEVVGRLQKSEEVVGKSAKSVGPREKFRAIFAIVLVRIRSGTASCPGAQSRSTNEY